MKWSWVLTLVLCACTGSKGSDDPGSLQRTDGGDGATPPAEAAVHFIGRFDTSATAGAKADWSATTVYATFNGTGVSARLDGDDNYFQVFIDGLDMGFVHFVPGVAPNSAQTLSLASGLPSARHTVALTRRTEAFLHPTQFLGFTVTGGQVIETPFPYTRRIEAIGDSITCGYGDEGEDEFCTFSPRTENAASSYVAQTARELDAALSVIAFSGKGMYRDLDFSMDLTMPMLYDRTLYAEPAKKWDFAEDVPDVVVINLGTNDFANGDAGQPYVDTYVEFLQRLRALYPAAEIFCLAGGMINTPVYLGAVQAVVAQSRAAGDTHVYYVELPPTRAGDFGCDYHPGPRAHAASAATLTEAIRGVTNW